MRPAAEQHAGAAVPPESPALLRRGPAADARPLAPPAGLDMLPPLQTALPPAPALADLAANEPPPADVEVEIAWAPPPIKSPAALEISGEQALDEPPAAPRQEAGPRKKIEPPAGQPAAPPQGAWPLSRTLLGEFGELSEETGCRVWALEVVERLETLSILPSLFSPQALAAVQRLNGLALEADSIAGGVDSGHIRSRVLRAGYALFRRSVVWEAIALAAGRDDSLGDAAATARVGDEPDMAASLAQVNRLLASLHGSEQWAAYLLLSECAAADEDGGDDLRREVATAILQRLDEQRLTDEQAAFLAAPVFQPWRSELRRWASRRIDFEQLLANLERYEETDGSSFAEKVAADWQSLRWSPRAEYLEVADRLDTYYRNANVRVAISGALMNRMMPPPPGPIEQPLNDNLFGARVSGVSRANTSRVLLRLIPDRMRWRMGLEAVGEVDSNTAATSGPVRLFNRASGRYHVRKLFTIDPRGIRSWNAEAEADGDARLTGVESEYDDFPLIGFFARSIAQQQHDEQLGAVRRQMRHRIETNAAERMDVEVDRQLSQAEQRFRRQVLTPLQKLELEPVPIDMQTTEERAIARYRLAGREQLAAHTPRPLAPSDSWLSVQLHQSAINNAIERLNYNGRRTDLASLYNELAEIVGRGGSPPPEDLPDGVEIEFAPRDCLRVDFDEGQVVITLYLSELAGNGASFRNFGVRAFYRPVIRGRRLVFVREGPIHLPVGRLKTGEQFALRAIFSKVFAKSREIDVTPQMLLEDERLSDLNISQVVLGEGWLGLAISQGRIARLPE